MSPSATLKMFIMRLDNQYESSIYFKLAIYHEFAILISSFMALHRYVFSPKKRRRSKYLSI